MAVYLGATDSPFTAVGTTIATPFGILCAPTTRVAAYVRSAGVPANADEFIRTNWVSSLAAALIRCRDGYGDTIFVLPGHTENVADTTNLTNMVSGVNIIGIGRGTARPKFTWTATGGQFALNQANVLLENLVFDMTGANGVTKAMLITAAEVAIKGCDFICAAGATTYAAIPLEVGTGGDRVEITRNRFRGVTGAPTELVNIAGTPDSVLFADNVLSSSAGSGLLMNVAAAATKLMIVNNQFYAYSTAGATALNIANAASTGFVDGNRLYIQNSGTAASTGIAFGSSTLIQCGLNYNCDEVKTSGVLCPAGSS